jgi:hypothetical protein
MKDFLRFLREQPLWWLVPLFVLFGVLVWLARVQASAPDSPFVYRL